MNPLKTENKDVRIQKVDRQTLLLMSYYNHRFNAGYVSLSGTKRDRRDGEDWWRPSVELSDQCKVRFSSKGIDVIYEAQKFLSKADDGQLLPPYYIKEGRDAHGKSKYTHCMPVTRDGIQIVLTSDLKLLSNLAMAQYASNKKLKIVDYTASNGVVCPLIEMSDKYIAKLFEQAQQTYHKSILLYTHIIDLTAIEIHFKIDEGTSREPPYGKLLTYSSPTVFRNYGFVKFKKGEVFDNPSTLHKFDEENIEDCLPKDKK